MFLKEGFLSVTPDITSYTKVICIKECIFDNKKKGWYKTLSHPFLPYNEE